jgi:hypothetical protein
LMTLPVQRQGAVRLQGWPLLLPKGADHVG